MSTSYDFHNLELFSNFAVMKRYANPYFEGIDIQFWHDLMESCGELVILKRGEFLCKKGELTKAFGYVKSGYLIYKIDGLHKPNAIGGFVFPDALWGIIQIVWRMLLPGLISLPEEKLRYG